MLKLTASRAAAVLCLALTFYTVSAHKARQLAPSLARDGGGLPLEPVAWPHPAGVAYLQTVNKEYFPPGIFWHKDLLRNATTVRAPEQFAPLFHRLDNGQPIVVVALGSSIVSEHGGCFNEEVAQKLSPIYEGYNLCKRNPTAGGFLTNVMHAINMTWPHPQHALMNHGVPGATFDMYTDHACLESRMPPEVHLIIVEQHEQSTYGRVLAEKLVWRLTRHFKDSQPTIILLNGMWLRGGKLNEAQKSWVQAPDGTDKTGDCLRNKGALCDTMCPPSNFTSIVRDAEAGRLEIGEDAINPVFRHYGRSAVSMRKFWGSCIAQGYHKHLNLTECSFMSKFLNDMVHPSRLGEILWSHLILQQLVDGQEWYHTNLQRLQAAARLEAKIASAAKHHNASAAGGGLTAASANSLHMLVESSNGGLPFNLHHHSIEAIEPSTHDIEFVRCYVPFPASYGSGTGNNVAAASAVAAEGAARGSAGGSVAAGGSSKGNAAATGQQVPVVESSTAAMYRFQVLRSQGFKQVEFQDSASGSTRYKPGWQATEAGSFLEIEVNTMFVSEGNTTDKCLSGRRHETLGCVTSNGKPITKADNATMAVAHLISYEGMGMCSVTCVAGCACDPQTINGDSTEAYGRASVSMNHVFKLTQHPRCRLRFEVLQESKSKDKGHKVKIVQVAASLQQNFYRALGNYGRRRDKRRRALHLLM